MSAQLKKFAEPVGRRDYLAVGYVQHNPDDCDVPFHACRADGSEDWFFSYADAWQFIAEGLVPPTKTYVMP